MADDPESRRPQERDFHVDQWEKFPSRRKENPFKNRADERKNDDQQSQYEYEGWEHDAFPNEDVSEEPAESVDLLSSESKSPPKEKSKHKDPPR
jgi:hypothetical protein